MQHRIAIARFAYGSRVHASLVDWFTDAWLWLHGDPHVAGLARFTIDLCPTDAARNLAVKQARQLGCQWLLMLDDDMTFDAYASAGAPKFLEVAWPFAVRHYDQGPCVIAAPYCGPAGDRTNRFTQEDVYVGEFNSPYSAESAPEVDYNLQPVPRVKAAELTGIREQAYLPTGLSLWDLRAFDRIKTPWFAYEYADEACTEKVSTEDTVCTRNLALAGVPLYCAWDCWAIHWKQTPIGRPQPLKPSDVAKTIRANLGV